MKHRMAQWSALVAGCAVLLAAAAWVASSLADLGETPAVEREAGGESSAGSQNPLPYAAFEGTRSAVDRLADRPSLALSALVDYDGDGVFSISESGPGESALWRYTITNTGNCRLRDVGLVDSLHATGGYDNVLDPGKSMTWEVSLPVEADLSNRAQATARAPDGSWIEPVWATTTVRRTD